jgi:hypothetical protein
MIGNVVITTVLPSQKTDGIVLKNVEVTYSSGESSTKIVTDIYIKYPPVYFNELTENPPIMDYALVADEGIKVRGDGNKITGSVYSGNNTKAISLNIIKNASLTLNNSIYAVVSGNIEIGDNSELITKGYTNLWSRNIIMDEYGKLNTQGTVNTVNDIEIKDEAEISMEGSYYGFGSPTSFVNDRSEYLSNNKLIEFSNEHNSNILIDGINVTLDLEELSYLILGGTGVIGTPSIPSDETIGAEFMPLVYMVPDDLMLDCNNPVSKDIYNSKEGNCVSLGSSEYTKVTYKKTGYDSMIYFFMKFNIFITYFFRC